MKKVFEEEFEEKIFEKELEKEMHWFGITIMVLIFLLTLKLIN